MSEAIADDAEEVERWTSMMQTFLDEEPQTEEIPRGQAEKTPEEMAIALRGKCRILRIVANLQTSLIHWSEYGESEVVHGKAIETCKMMTQDDYHYFLPRRPDNKMSLGTSPLRFALRWSAMRNATSDCQLQWV